MMNWFLSMCPDIKSKKYTKYQNNIVWQNTFMNLMNIATYAFEWSGLPDTCNERFLELALLTNGKACICKDPELGFLSLKAHSAGGLNLYGEIPKFFATGINGYNKEYTAYLVGTDNTNANAVLCRDNNMMIPYVRYIIRATDRLMSAERSIDVASKKLKNPYFITADETQVNSIKKILNDVDDNQESVITSKTTMPDGFKVFPTNVDVTTLKTLWEHYNNIDNSIRTMLGINNNSTSGKRERLIVDEINVNNDYTDINIDMRLHERQLFCDRVNELFGLNISVDKRFKQDEQEVDNDEVQDTKPTDENS